MFNKFFFSVVLFAFSTLFAQNESQQVNLILDKTAQKYSSLSTFSINFSVKIGAENLVLQNFDGTLLVKKEKYFITFEDQIIANDGNMVWNYQKNINEVSIFEVEDDFFAIFSPNKMLNNWNKEYSAKFIRKEESQKKMNFIVDLTPKMKSQFYKIRLYIEEVTSYISMIMMYDVEGTTFTYSISKFLPNDFVSDDKFIFNLNDYPNVQVNDMR
ncbi:MAG: outer membrane lipoprotein carrier protein LolA [Bacteroidales bacterium]|jgi:outer membrane lipoprotein-sorting protein|nr:outer membrane lipoprotein carrier protein LolA [Bacteroidales bacterium]